MVTVFFYLKFYIYIHYSEKSHIYYISPTENVERQFLEHNETSENSFTSLHRRWKLMASFPVGTSRGLALKIERHLKKQSSRQYIEDLINRKSVSGSIKRSGKKAEEIKF